MSESGSARLPVEVRVKVGVDGGSEDDGQVIRLLGWRNGAGEEFNPGTAELVAGTSGRYEFEVRSDLAVDVEPRIVEL